MYSFKFGREAMEFRLPPGISTVDVTPRSMMPIPNLRAALHETLKDPMGRPPLDTLARKVSSAMIVVEDSGYYTAYPQWLPELLNFLNQAGISDENISLYVASGLKNPPDKYLRAEYYSAEVCDRVQFIEHEAGMDGCFSKNGRTDYGTILRMDDRVRDAELVILTGGIKLHPFCGFTGSHGRLIPGCCSSDTTFSNQSHLWDARAADRHPRACSGSLIMNPVSEDMLEAHSLFSPDFSINVVVNDDGEIVWMQGGDAGYALRYGAKFIEDHNRVEMRPVDIAIINAGGYPNDSSLYRAFASLDHASAVLKPGASVFWIARCQGGEGHQEFSDMAELSVDAIREIVGRRPTFAGATALLLKQYCERYRIHLVSELDPEQVLPWGMTPHEDLGRALSLGLPPHAEQLDWLVASNSSNMLLRAPVGVGA
ncbi:DUF2088 domain-containing protein [bacterium]|nr:DUF2088 domain-containing protein [bacterium]